MQLRETKERQVRKLCAEKNIVPKISNFWIELVKLDSITGPSPDTPWRTMGRRATSQTYRSERPPPSYVKSQLISYEEKLDLRPRENSGAYRDPAATAVTYC